MNIPTIDTLERWLSAHNLTAFIHRDVVITKLWSDDKISHRVDVPRQIDEVELTTVERACNIMAYDCGIVPPRVAMNLNHPSFRCVDADTL